ncbi:MAG: hypothetical protein B6241_00795 [Spirochaetaceae bacterium 4572_59]|nr:MAG: hypothetical protein B6241_00795 [Spirochaetaceae bacterium 4572_59]
MPEKGFIKIPESGTVSLTPERKVKLLRKGNKLFNEGDIETAERIFVTIGYRDGMIRVGDYYYNQNLHLEALRMYKTAPSPEKIDFLISKMAQVVRSWLSDN